MLKSKIKHSALFCLVTVASHNGTSQRISQNMLVFREFNRVTPLKIEKEIIPLKRVIKCWK